MRWMSWRAGLLAGAVALLAAPAGAQVLGPPGVPPSEARAGQPAPLVKEVPADGPMCCEPRVEVKKIDKRCYTDRCYNICYPKCGGLFHRSCGGGGGGECEAPCDEGACHKCGKVYTRKYLVLHIRKEEEHVNVCVPVPAACEAPCVEAPSCGAPYPPHCQGPVVVPPPGYGHPAVLPGNPMPQGK